MRTATRFIAWFVCVVVIATIVYLVCNFLFPGFPSWRVFAIQFVVCAAGTVLMNWAEKHCHLRSTGLFTKPRHVQEREQELARAREQIIADAKRT